MQVSEHFARSAQELEGVFEFLASFADEVELGPKDRYALDFAVEELFTNFVKYNDGQHPIEIRVGCEEQQLELVLFDREVEDFDPTSARDPRVHAGVQEREPGGLGLHLVRALYDSLEYRYDGANLLVTATKQVEAPQPPDVRDPVHR